MSEGEQAVVGVLTIQEVVPPMAVKPSFVAPEGVDEVQAIFLAFPDAALQPGEGVQSGGGGKQVRQRSLGGGEETSLRMALRQQPVGQVRWRSNPPLAEKRDGCRSGVG